MVPNFENYVIFDGPNGLILVSRKDIKYLTKIETLGQNHFKLFFNLPPKLGRSYSVEVNETIAFLESLINSVNYRWWKFWA